MPTALLVPRVNSNDDIVRVARVLVERRAAVMGGDPVAEVTTDKATFVVEAEEAGVIIDVCVEPGQDVEVGAVMMWLGATEHEVVPENGRAEAASSNVPRATLKARALAARYGLDPAALSGSRRVSAADVESYAAGVGLPGGRYRRSPLRLRPEARGRLVPLEPAVQAMCRSVSWHAGSAVPAYVELRYDPRPWSEYAHRFQNIHNVLLNPLLSLMAWRLGRLVAERSEWNSTVIDDERYQYEQVNLGFTVYNEGVVYLVVVHDVERLSARECCDRLFELQRQAAGDTIDARSMAGATVTFSSMARWRVSRHVPVLPPYTSVIVGQAMPAADEGVLGATYDHRLHTGSDVAMLLERLARPEDEPQAAP